MRSDCLLHYNSNLWRLQWHDVRILISFNKFSRQDYWICIQRLAYFYSKKDLRTNLFPSKNINGDLGQWTMTKELAREVSCFYSSNHCEVWWIAESILNMSRSRADGTMSSWLLYFRNFTNFHTVSYIVWTPLWAKCASAPAILSNIPANGPSEIWSYFLSLKTIRAASFELFVICQCCYCWYCSRRLSNTIIC